MKIYCAGPWIEKAVLKDVAERLRVAGFTIVSRWHDNIHDPTVESTEAILIEEAKNDLNDIEQADTLVYINTATKSEGKATELGIALAWDYKIYMIGGKQNNVFCHLPQINHKANLASVIEALNEQ